MDNIVISDKTIENMIYEVRGRQVMLASDVAKLYQVETKRVNEVIKRNVNRFPETFCFQLINEEINQLSLRSQFATLNKNNNMRGQHYKYLPYVLTEEGILMLSGLLKSDIAAKVNVKVVEAFVKMKRYINNSSYQIGIINTKLLEYDNRLSVVENTLDKLNEKEKVNTIFFQGQIFDAHSVLMDILGKAKNEIIIIDDYAGSSLLKILKDIDKKIIIISNNLNEVSIKKYKSQYHNVEFIKSNKFHDRFIILDRDILYHSGASFKDLGTKCFAINKIDIPKYISDIINEIK